MMFLDKIRELVGNGNTDRSIKELLTYAKENHEELINRIILLKGRYKNLNDSHNSDTISRENFLIESAKINDAILKIVNELESSSSPLPIIKTSQNTKRQGYKNLKIGLLVSIILVLAVLVVLLLVKSGHEGEIFAEPANELGPEPFTPTIFAKITPENVVSVIDVDTFEQEQQAVIRQGLNGSTPGLYGGTQNKSYCNPLQLAEYLLENIDKAKAWVDALNTDSSLLWSKKGKLEVGSIGEYIEELTPSLLLHDVRVTNHGFRDGKPTPRQSVLQKGTAILLDRYGVPRVRCACGNPLMSPIQVKSKPRYVGDLWEEFDASKIVYIYPSSMAIDIFNLSELGTNERFKRPVGTGGNNDAQSEVPFSVQANQSSWIGFWYTDFWGPLRIVENHGALRILGAKNYITDKYAWEIESFNDNSINGKLYWLSKMEDDEEYVPGQFTFRYIGMKEDALGNLRETFAAIISFDGEVFREWEADKAEGRDEKYEFRFNTPKLE